MASSQPLMTAVRRFPFPLRLPRPDLPVAGSDGRRLENAGTPWRAWAFRIRFAKRASHSCWEPCRGTTRWGFPIRSPAQADEERVIPLRADCRNQGQGHASTDDIDDPLRAVAVR